MLAMTLEFTLNEWTWQKDMDGDEAGFPKSTIVTHYIRRADDEVINAYIDLETGAILDWWHDED